MCTCVCVWGGGGGGGGGGEKEGVVNMYICIYKDLCRRVWETCSNHMDI